LTFPNVNHKKKNEGVNEGVNLKIEGVNENITIELQCVINYLRNNPTSKTNEISEYIGKSVSTTERYLRILKEQNIIVFERTPKTGGYILKKED